VSRPHLKEDRPADTEPSEARKAGPGWGGRDWTGGGSLCARGGQQRFQLSLPVRRSAVLALTGARRRCVAMAEPLLGQQPSSRCRRRSVNRSRCAAWSVPAADARRSAASAPGRARSSDRHSACAADARRCRRARVSSGFASMPVAGRSASVRSNCTYVERLGLSARSDGNGG